MNCADWFPTAQSTKTERTNEAPTVKQATKLVFARPMNRPSTPQRKAPASGRATITQRRLARFSGAGYGSMKGLRTSASIGRSEPHGPDVVDVHRAAAPEHGDDHRQSDGGLGGRDGDDEERRQVTHVHARIAGEGEEGEVGGVEHHLDAHEDHQRVAADQDAEHAQAEEQGGQEEVVLQRDAVHGLPPCQTRDLATTTAPTMATRRSSDTASNGASHWV